MQISAQQLAELLLGIARAQAALVHGLESEMAGIRSGHLATLGRQIPDVAALVRDIERLVGARSAAPAPEPSGALDFSKS